MTLTNPFLLGIALMDLAGGLWYLAHGNKVMGVSMVAFTIASSIQAFGTVQ